MTRNSLSMACCATSASSHAASHARLSPFCSVFDRRGAQDACREVRPSVRVHADYGTGFAGEGSGEVLSAWRDSDRVRLPVWKGELVPWLRSMAGQAQGTVARRWCFSVSDLHKGWPDGFPRRRKVKREDQINLIETVEDRLNKLAERTWQGWPARL